MSQPKHFKHYSREYLDILERLGADPTIRIPLECGTRKRAVAVKQQLYGFRKAIEADPEMLAMYPEAPSLMVTEDSDDDTKLVILHRDHSPITNVLRDGLKKLDDQS